MTILEAVRRFFAINHPGCVVSKVWRDGQNWHISTHSIGEVVVPDMELLKHVIESQSGVERR